MHDHFELFEVLPAPLDRDIDRLPPLVLGLSEQILLFRGFRKGFAILNTVIHEHGQGFMGIVHGLVQVLAKTGALRKRRDRASPVRTAPHIAFVASSAAGY